MQVSSHMKLGVDTGGTFTDFILQTGDVLRRYKCPSTPADPSRAIMQGVDYFFPDGVPENLDIIHGTTVGTNAFLERKGGRCLLLTTRGFEDVLLIGRQNRASLFDLNVMRPAPILDEHLIVGVSERIDARGQVVLPVCEADLVQVEALVQNNFVDTVVICFLHSFLNDIHERKVQQLLSDLTVPVLCSIDILPEFREFERCSTAVINGYLAPVMSAYIQNLTARLAGRRLSVQQSNGGVMAAGAVQERAAHTLLSGPAAGVQGAYQLSVIKQQTALITFDMGGTSTDVSLCDGSLSHTREYILDGYPLGIPMLDIHTIGAGGGSIAYIDRAGVLQVGPESAGADPGPVCYGVGEHITVTDANLLLGRLLPDVFLGGRMSLGLERTVRYAQKMACELDVTVDELCLGIIAIVNAGMVKAVCSVSLDRGYDPADFVLYSFGGSSGLHCCELVCELGMTTIEIPARAGVLSAQGLIFSPPLLDRTRALFLQGKECSYENVKKYALTLEAEVREQFLDMVSDKNVMGESFVDLRYVGQSYEISIPVQSDMVQQFHVKHKKLFGYDFMNRSIECVSLRSVAKKSQQQNKIPVLLKEKNTSNPKVRTVLFACEKLNILVYERQYLPMEKLYGPCLIVDDYTTVLVTSLFSFEVDEAGSLTLKKERRV